MMISDPKSATFQVPYHVTVLILISLLLLGCASAPSPQIENLGPVTAGNAIQNTETTTVGSVLFDQTLASIRLTRTETIGVEGFKKERNQIEAITGKQMSVEEQKQLLDYLLDELLLVQAANEAKLFIPSTDLELELQNRRSKLGLTENAAYEQAVLQSFPSMDAYKKSVENQMLRDKYLQSQNAQAYGMPLVSPEEIQQAYVANITQFAIPGQVEFQHLYLPFRAINPEQRVQAQTRFEAIAADIAARGRSAWQEYATGPGLNREYLFAAGALTQDEQFVQTFGQGFIQSVFALNPQAISPVLQSTQGLHIVSVTAKRDPQVLPIDQEITIEGRRTSPRVLIQLSLAEQKRNRLIAQARKTTVDSLRTRADIYKDASYDWTQR